MPVVTLFEATCEGQLVGFKIGFAMKLDHYYSWLGGVHPDYQRNKIATELMRLQHMWLRDEGYRTVETSAQQNNHAMGKLNLDSGFQVVGLRFKDQLPFVEYEKIL